VSNKEIEPPSIAIKTAARPVARTGNQQQFKILIGFD
jgi:hypothetical protein